METKTKRQHSSTHELIYAGLVLFDLSTTGSTAGAEESNALQLECRGHIKRSPSGFELAVDLDQVFSVEPKEAEKPDRIFSCIWSLKVQATIKTDDKIIVESRGENEGLITEFRVTAQKRRNIYNMVLARGNSYLGQFERPRPAGLKLILEAELEITHKIQDGRQNGKMISNSRPTGLDLLQLLRKDFSDVTIKCDSEDIKAHKIVPTTCSPVFARTLDSPMDESVTSVISINDFEPETIQSMITFLYEGMLDATSKDSIVALLDCAEKYDIQELKVSVIKKMLSIISPDNAAEFAAAVTKFRGDEKSKQVIFDYCKANFSRLTASSHFRQFFKNNVQFFL